MKFKEGHQKVGGRVAGTPNKKTERLLDILGTYGIEPVKEIVSLLPALTPKEQVDVYRDLLSYIYPKRKAVEYSGESIHPVTELSDSELSDSELSDSELSDSELDDKLAEMMKKLNTQMR